MNSQIIINAVIAFFIALGGSLLTLWTGIKEFGEVAPPAYGMAVVSALLSALKDVYSLRSDSPTNIKQTNDIVSAAANLDIKQSGFALPQFAGVLLVLMLALIVLPSCAQYTASPNKTIASASLVIEQLAIQIDQAQKSGQISNAREDQLLDSLKQINGDLRVAASLSGDSQTQSLADINARLSALRAELAQEKQQ